ncbi:MAG: saccharopine dehydrogenase NADP-binding domain-containing protein [Candidatus Nezhaarchaeales archaeon]
MKVLVLGGAGHIGSKIVLELRNLDPSMKIVIGDKNVERAQSVASEVGGDVEVLVIDAVAEDSLIDAMKRFDVIVSALGPFYRFGVPVLRAAIRAGVNFVDINDDYDATEEALKLHEEAQRKGVVALIGLGATPGITNMLAYQGARILDEVHEIGTYWVWTALDPTMGPAIIDHFFHAITGMVVTYKDNKWIKIPALCEPERFKFPSPIGAWEVAHVGHPEPVTIPRYIKVKNVYNKGGVWPSELNEVAKVFSKLGLTSFEEVRVKDQAFKAREVAVAIAISLPKLMPPEEIERMVAPLYEKMGDYVLTGVGLATVVKGFKDEKGFTIKYGIACKDSARLTALPVALATLELATKRDIKAGVYPPEAGVINVDRIIESIKKLVTIEFVEERVENAVTI